MNLLEALHWVGGGPLAVVLILAGFYLTMRSGFIPLRRFPAVVYLTLGTLFRRCGREVRPGDISPFQALTTALAATVGTGNIAGVATAITLGGPGAIFWMWVSAFFGMTTKFSEIVLAVHYRRRTRDGGVVGGPMYALEHGLGYRFLGLLFALFGATAAFGIGNLVQANSLAAVVRVTFGVPPLLTGIVLAALIAVVILGGIHRIGSITEKLVPSMALFYVISALVILLLHYTALPGALAEIIRGAFTGRAAAGGFAGAGVLQGMRYGVTRGVFSNEAGLGSASIAHAAARTDHPVRQGLWGIIEVFIDTHVICTLTALVLLATGAWTGSQEGASMTAEAFNRGLPGPGSVIVTIGLIFFAFSTLLSWSYYGEKCFEYLTAGVGGIYYRLAWIALIVVGSMGGLRAVWAIADTLNALMALPNLVGLLGLSGLVFQLNRQFWKK
ncbi:MAG: sodium:alanine symporter family protein [Bacillota bacterium]